MSNRSKQKQQSSVNRDSKRITRDSDARIFRPDSTYLYDTDLFKSLTLDPNDWRYRDESWAQDRRKYLQKSIPLTIYGLPAAYTLALRNKKTGKPHSLAKARIAFRDSDKVLVCIRRAARRAAVFAASRVLSRGGLGGGRKLLRLWPKGQHKWNEHSSVVC